MPSLNKTECFDSAASFSQRLDSVSRFLYEEILSISTACTRFRIRKIPQMFRRVHKMDYRRLLLKDLCLFSSHSARSSFGCETNAPLSSRAVLQSLRVIGF